MNILSEEDEREAVAVLRAAGYPNPEGAVADAKAKLAAALKDGLLELHTVNGELSVKVSDAKRLWPGYEEFDEGGR